ncbi:jacalin-like lectin [Qipengyuania sp.]|uniref:jacalin-like lectin n=1 Tax=Qipengyuania sp. TaxID=2004515 RepID=UPI003AF516B7
MWTDHTPAAPSEDEQRDDAVEKLAADVSATTPYVRVLIIGGGGGTAFSFYGGSDGAMIEKIGVWIGGWQIKAVKVWLTNGRVEQFGNGSGPYQEFAFEKGELITSMSLWGNGAGTRLGAIKFKTNRNREFFAKMNKWGLKQEYPIDVGSGLCVGVMGRAGSDVDSMGFVFVKPIRESVMLNMNYPTIGLETPNVRPDSIASTTYENELDEPQEYTFEASKKLTRKEAWSITAGMEFALSYKVTAGIPIVAQTETGFSFKVSVSGTYGQENTEEKTETWKFPIKVPAKTTVDATMTIGRADISLPYNAQVKVVTTDGSELVFDVNGSYDGITYTKVHVKVTDVNAAAGAKPLDDRWIES